MIVKRQSDKAIEEIEKDAPEQYDTFKEVADELVQISQNLQLLQSQVQTLTDCGTIEDFEIEL